METEASPKTQVLVQSIFFALFFGFTAWSLGMLVNRFALLDHSWAVFWPVNGVIVALLLSKQRRAWPLLLFSILCGTTISQTLIGGGWRSAAIGAGMNAIEVLIAASILPQFSNLPQWLREPHLVYRFLLGAFVLGPGASGLLSALYYHHQDPSVSFVHVFEAWSLARALGMASTIPLVLAVCRRSAWEFSKPLSAGRTLLMLGLMAGTTIGVFAQGQYSLLFILFPVLGLVMFYSGFVGAMMAIELICVISIYLTMHHMGPVVAGTSTDHRVLFVQLFLSYVVMLGFPVSVLLAERRAFALKITNRERQYRLLAESSRDVIILTDFQGVREFVSPACNEILGYSPEELMGQHFSDGVHPDDHAMCNSILQDIKLSLSSSEVLIYRTLAKNGEYVWVEGRLRAITDEVSGDVTGCLITLRDITEHKRLQRKLEEACTKLEHQASFDALTNVANRRRFDDIFEQEWRRAAREAQPLALMLIDIDNFKTYNDEHGHPAGDECLRAVAHVLATHARRPGDLVARYGGEEFAVLLPSTDLRGSCELGERIRKAVEALRLPTSVSSEIPATDKDEDTETTHDAAPRYGRYSDKAAAASGSYLDDSQRTVTRTRDMLDDPTVEKSASASVFITSISVGCAAVIPGGVDGPSTLIEEADRALYLAKANGRNRVEAKPGPRPVSLTSAAENAVFA